MSFTVVKLYPPPRPDVRKHSLLFTGGSTSADKWNYGGHDFINGIRDNPISTALRPSSQEHDIMGSAPSSAGRFQLLGIGSSNKEFDVTIGAVWIFSSGGTRAFVGLFYNVGFVGDDTPRPFIGFFHRLTLGPNWYAATGTTVGPSSTVVDTGVAVGLGETANPWLFRLQRVSSGPVIFSLNGVQVASIDTSIPVFPLRVMMSQNNGGTGRHRTYGWAGYGNPLA